MKKYCISFYYQRASNFRDKGRSSVAILNKMKLASPPEPSEKVEPASLSEPQQHTQLSSPAEALGAERAGPLGVTRGRAPGNPSSSGLSVAPL